MKEQGMSDNQSRRDFFKLVGIGIAAGSLANMVDGGFASLHAQRRRRRLPFELGLASYTFRKFSVDDVISAMQKMDLKRTTFKSMHLPLDSTPEQIKATVDKVREAGITLYGAGVVYMKDEAEVNNAFEYAKTAGMEMIVGVPEHHLLTLVEKKVAETDIKLAIHNHGPGDQRYPTAESAYDLIKDLDARMGLCIDIGHTQRMGIDPTDDVQKFFRRIFDIHVKDVNAPTEEGKTVEIGRGVIDIPRLLNTLKQLNYSGTLALEYEKDADDPLAGAAESIGYLRGVMATL